MQVLFIQTGGTIDKDYPTQGVAYAFEIATPAVERILKVVNPSFTYRCVELLKKDSTDISDEDRALIATTCQNAKEDKIVITHGTDTMVNTARVLSSIKNKVIVITGSMRPERFSESDAHFNVGTAVAALSLAKPGVYIAMSGQVLPWDRIDKNYDLGYFVEK
jgi:L-asparaginase